MVLPFLHRLFVINANKHDAYLCAVSSCYVWPVFRNIFCFFYRLEEIEVSGCMWGFSFYPSNSLD